MKNVHKSVLIWYSPEEMFALVTQVSLYPQFLPWCDQAAILTEDASGMTAEVGIAFGGIHQKFVTHNIHVSAPSGHQVLMKLIKGPFSNLDGTWSFAPVGDGSQRACRVDLQLNYGFDSIALSALVGPVFDRIAGSMVDAFVKRAVQVYG